MTNIDTLTGLYRQILETMGEDPQREGLLDTPKRTAKAMAFRMLNAAGFEPLDCGTADDAKGIEPCSAPYNRPERVRHPKHLAFNGPNHP